MPEPIYEGECTICEALVQGIPGGERAHVEEPSEPHTPLVAHWRLTKPGKELFCKVCQTCGVRVWRSDKGTWHHISDDDKSGIELDDEHGVVPIYPDPTYLEQGTEP